MKTSSRFAAFVARVINFAPRGRASYAAERKIQILGSSFQLLLREKTLFNAAFIKLAQTFLLFLSKAESEMFAVITGAELRIEFFSMARVIPHARGYNLRDYLIKIGEVLIAQSAQPV